jgi:HD-like signal output (HDOD) protein
VADRWLDSPRISPDFGLKPGRFVADPLGAMTMYQLFPEPIFPDPLSRADRAREILRKAHAVSPSPSLLRIEEQIRRGDGSSRQLASLIEGSPALAARVLRMANSAFYAPLEQVSSLGRAVTMLGETVIRQLVLTSLVLSRRSGLRSPEEALATARVMGDAVRAAAICRDLAGLTRISSPDEAFSTGLLHDLGHIYLLDDVSASYAAYLLAGYAGDSLVREEELAGTTHQDVGAAFAFDWNLPDGIASAMREHHNAPPMSLPALVHAADTIVRELNHSDPNAVDASAAAVDVALGAIGVERATWAARVDKVRDEYGSLLTLFESMAA